MAYTEAQKRATNKWIKKNYERVNLTLPAGMKEEWKQVAERSGMSLNDFIRKCVSEKI